jgi:hypothetical protein
MRDDDNDAETKIVQFPEITEASLEMAARVSAAVKGDKPGGKRPAPKIGLETVIDANGNGSYFLPDAEATNRFADSVSRLTKKDPQDGPQGGPR